MSEAWKKHDRQCPPCRYCGAELYEKFWGNGGWAKTDKATDQAHSDRDCVARLGGLLNELYQAVLADPGACAQTVSVAMRARQALAPTSVKTG
jgi:hypothetical protein